MPFYDTPRLMGAYPLGEHDFGEGNGVFAIVGPKGKAGRLFDYGVQACTETFNAVTTEASVKVGTASDDDAFGTALGLGTLAVNTAKTVRSTYDQVADAAAFDALVVEENIPADTVVLVTCTAPVGGTPAGKAVPFIQIAWDD